MRVATFTIAGEPVSKSRARFTKRGSKTYAYTPQKTLDGEKAIALSFRSVARGHVADGSAAYRVEAEFHNGTRQRRDIDNMMKLILDGLNGVAWADDNQVTEIKAVKYWVARDEAKTVVTIHRLGDLNPPTAGCIRCGKEFRTYASWVNNPNGKKYCSTDCAYTHRVERRERTCGHCAATFLAWGEQSSTKFCSTECAHESRRVEVQCGACGESFTRARNLIRKTNYCSSRCAALGANEQRRSRLPGTCRLCGGGTTKKEYQRCAGCKRSKRKAA